MDNELQLKVQAYLDRELSPGETGQIERLVAVEPEAQALLAELNISNSAMKEFEQALKLPESREFYWSKIERAIQSRPLAKPATERVSWATAWRRLLVPAGAIAALVLAILLTLGPQKVGPSHSVLADPATLTYHDYDARATLVWLSYPAENELADNDLSDLLP